LVGGGESRFGGEVGFVEGGGEGLDGFEVGREGGVGEEGAAELA
jgi:hypothetical protein